MLTSTPVGWATVEVVSEGEGTVVKIKSLKIYHPEHIHQVMKQVVEDAPGFPIRVDVPSEIWTRFNSIYWQTAGFRPPKNHREGTMYWEPKYEQSDYLGQIQ